MSIVQYIHSTRNQRGRPSDQSLLATEIAMNLAGHYSSQVPSSSSSSGCVAAPEGLSFPELWVPEVSFVGVSLPALALPVLSFPELSSPSLSFALHSSPLLSFPSSSLPLLSSELYSRLRPRFWPRQRTRQRTRLWTRLWSGFWSRFWSRFRSRRWPGLRPRRLRFHIRLQLNQYPRLHHSRSTFWAYFSRYPEKPSPYIGKTSVSHQ